MRKFINIVNEGLTRDIPVDKIVKATIAEFNRRNPEATGQDINDGVWSLAFAEQVWEAMDRRGEVVPTETLDGVFGGHSVYKFEGKYYDAEDPDGVTDPRMMRFNLRRKANAQANRRA